MNTFLKILSISLLVFAGSQTLAEDPFAAGLRSVKIAVDDFEKAIAFYSALGMKEGASHSPAVKEMNWEATTRNSGIIMVSPEYPGRSSLVRGGAYLMITTPDTQAVAERLRNSGFSEIGEPKAMGSMVSILMLKDPDGNVIELMGPLPGK